MTLEPAERGPDVAANGVDRADGRAADDPAHRGPLPEATMLEIAGRLINDVSDLADRQIELAKQEINEAKDDALLQVKRVAIGAGIAAAAALLLVIWAWGAFIWFFNWLGELIVLQIPVAGHVIGLVGGAIIGGAAGYWLGSNVWSGWRLLLAGLVGFLLGGLIGGGAGLGWFLGVLVPAVAGGIAYRFIRQGVLAAMGIWPPLPRTRETLKGDLEWLQALRTPNAR